MCSNRTFMELKSRLYDNTLRAFASSNRTFMELKLVTVTASCASFSKF